MGGEERINLIDPSRESDESLESPRFMWAMAGALFAAGGTIGALSLLVPHPVMFDDAALWSNIALAYAGALLCYLAASRTRATWPIQVVLVLGTGLVTRAAYYSNDPNGFYTLFYVWIGLYAFFFFARANAVAQMAFVALAYAWVLAELDATAAFARWITTIGTIVLGAAMIDSLVRRVRSMARRSAAIATEREELLGLLEVVARTDELTGLPNRRAWEEALTRELARAERDGTPLSVGFIDLDRFKAFNDQRGHQAGDRLLKEIAAAWREELRTSDVVARYGGEEFSVALPGCDLDDATALIERLRSVVPEGETCSAGIALWDRDEAGEVLLGRADKALYAAKAAGRNRAIVA